MPISLYALLIGINDYKDKSGTHNLGPLRGAVDDAKSFKALLQRRFGVPDNHMTLLTNEAATRSAIVRSFKNIENDRRIKRDDAIFIYYAGHGVQMKAPESWNWESATGTIQAIVPHDFNTILGYEKVHVISDRTLSALLTAIARKKGNNITVVFDSCYSASGTRNAGAHLATSDELEVTARFADINGEYPPTLDQHIWDVGTARNMSTPSNFAETGIESHVLLAACGAEETAWESISVGRNTSQPRGRFSTALLELLSNESESPTNIRYCDIITRLGPIKDQTPHCEGLHQDRFLFNSKVIPSRRERFGVQSPSPGRYIVDAGTVHPGITSQSTFALFKKSDINRARDPFPSIGTLSIQDLGPTSSVANVSFYSNYDYDGRSEIVAVLTKSGSTDDLRLFIPRKSPLFNIHPNLLRSGDDLSGVTLVELSSQADIEVCESNSQHPRTKIKIKITPPYHPCQKCYHNDLSRHPMIHFIDNDSSGWADTLSKAAKFYREFKIVDTVPPMPKFLEHIDFYFYQLVPNYSDIDHPTLSPVKPLVNLFENGIISLPHHPNIPYGLKLVNKTRSRNLYVNIFFLNNRELSIAHWVRSGKSNPQANLPDAQLRAQGTFLMGWGDAENSAKDCELDNDINFAVDYIKIYLSTEPVDLSYLSQPSGFSRGMKDHVYQHPTHLWMSEIIPVVQRRGP